jgi:hypothetical protein
MDHRRDTEFGFWHRKSGGGRGDPNITRGSKLDPMPRHQPLITAITCTGRVRTLSQRSPTRLINPRAVSGSSFTISLIFAPPIHARSPPPTTTRHRTESPPLIPVIARISGSILEMPRTFIFPALMFRYATPLPSHDSEKQAPLLSVSISCTVCSR